MIFGLLVALMLTGMPISIALGLTVLTFLFFMTSVPIESVALKLFTGIEKFEIMAIPFFILAGNFLTHGGVARRMIEFAQDDDRPLGRRTGHRRHDGGSAVFSGVGILAGDRRRDRLDHAAGDVVGRLSQALCRRRHRHRRRARQSDSALDHHGDLRGIDQRRGLFRPGRRAGQLRIGRAIVHGRHGAGRDPGDHAVGDHLVSRVEEQLSEGSEGDVGRGLARLPGIRSGAFR